MKIRFNSFGATKAVVVGLGVAVAVMILVAIRSGYLALSETTASIEELASGPVALTVAVVALLAGAIRCALGNSDSDNNPKNWFKED
jgi:hypothetical protein